MHPLKLNTSLTNKRRLVTPSKQYRNLLFPFPSSVFRIFALAMKRRLRWIVTCAIAFLSMIGKAQQPCVHIESIFVDACTLGGSCPSAATNTCSCEGKNEMMRFRLGDGDQLLSNLSINWPNNNFLGFCQNEQTAQNTADLNATIEACGWLIEPLDGVLPANSTVLLITSADMCTAANSFAGLADTLYVIYQCPGNFQGHFANFGSGLRTTTMTFGMGCNSTATYDRSLLVTQAGLPGAEDGATVNFDLQGNATYVNNGCTAPFNPSTVNAGADATGCPGDALELQATVSGAFSEFEWSGGSGTFANSNAQNTTYTIGPDDTGTVILTFSASDCNQTLTDQITITISGEPDATLDPAMPASICEGDPLEIALLGSGDVLWSTGESTPTISLNEPGDYSVTLSNNCGSTIIDFTIEQEDAPTLSLNPNGKIALCGDETALITAVSNSEVTWSDGSTANTFLADSPGTVTATASNGCGTLSQNIEVNVGDVPQPEILPNPLPLLCEGESITLTVSGSGTPVWNDGSTSQTLTVSTPGTYSVVLSNACGSGSTSVEVDSAGAPPTASISTTSTALCDGETTEINAVGTGEVLWNNGSTETSITVTAGTYTLTITNGCGSAEDNIVIAALENPSITLEGSPTVVLCDDDFVTLTVTANGPVEWSNGAEETTILVEAPGSYTATTSNACGDAIAVANVTASSVNAFFSASPPDGTAPLEVDFENLSTGANSYQWFIDGEPWDTDENTSYFFEFTGTFSVTLIAEDEFGCTDTHTIDVQVVDCNEPIVIPNVFSPNSDGINDRLVLPTECMRVMQFSVFNRWGALVFEAQRNSPFWDGRDASGSPLADGMYYAVMTYTDFNNTTTTLTGNVLLTR